MTDADDDVLFLVFLSVSTFVSGQNQFGNNSWTIGLRCIQIKVMNNIYESAGKKVKIGLEESGLICETMECGMNSHGTW